MDYNALIEIWKNQFQCLYFWNIQYLNDGEHFCNTLYSLKERNAMICACDTGDEAAYVLHEIIKLALIVTENNKDARTLLVEDICTLILRNEY